MFRAYLPSFACAAALYSVALFMMPLGGAPPFLVTLSYLATTTVAVLTSALIFMFVHVANSARQLADDPLPKAWAAFKPRAYLLLLPWLLGPVFFGAFTTVKTNMGTLAGFHWDHVFAAWDAAIFGQDPWRITHAFIGPKGTAVLQFFYLTVWLMVLAYSKTLTPLLASQRTASIFYNAMLSTWLIGGVFMAYAFSSAGPMYADMVDQSLAARFEPLNRHIAAMLGPNAAWVELPPKLKDSVLTGNLRIGSGVSAMPSMHLATVTIFILATRKTWAFWPAVLFAAIIFVGSVHSGNHYAVDVLAAPVAVICWKLAEYWADLTALHREPGVVRVVDAAGT